MHNRMLQYNIKSIYKHRSKCNILPKEDLQLLFYNVTK
jgi:hypothetical protein